MTYGILTLIHCCLPLSIHFASIWFASIQLTSHGQNTPSADSHEAWLSSMDLMTLAQLVVFITVEEMWRNQWKEKTIGTLKETRCHLETIEVPLMEKCISGD